MKSKAGKVQTESESHFKLDALGFVTSAAPSSSCRRQRPHSCAGLSFNTAQISFTETRLGSVSAVFKLI